MLPGTPVVDSALRNFYSLRPDEVRTLVAFDSDDEVDPMGARYWVAVGDNLEVSTAPAMRDDQLD